jgi:FkbM family methyltransferase
MCGHAFVGTVHEHLNDVDRQLGQLASQLGDLKAATDNLAESDRALLQGGIRTMEELVDRQLSPITSQLADLKAASDSLAEAEGALLQGGIRTVEELKDVQAQFRRQEAEAKQRLDEWEARWRELLGAWQSIREQNGHLIETFENRLARSHQATLEAVQQSYGHLIETFDDRLGRAHQTTLEAVQQSYGHLIETFEDRLGRAHQTTLEAVQQSYGHLIETFENRLGRAHQTTLDAVARLQNHIGRVLDNEVPRQVCVETGEYGFTNPEAGLLSFLYSYLPGHAALDIGANHGNVSEPLLKAGYEVYAFEPQPQVCEDLVRRLGNRDGFHVFPFALGSQEAEMPLHMAVDLSADKTYGDATGYSSLTQHSMPADLPFTSARPVMVKTLAGLHDAGTLPENIGLVKIDTEGYDLEVVRGMGERRYPVVATEFWDSGIPFGGANQLYTLESLVGEMRRRGYLWHIVLYRIWGQNQSGFYCNHDKSVPKTWGNVVFFQDYPVFAQAQAWCSAVLPRTYFKAVAQA